LSNKILKKYPSLNLNTIYQKNIGGMTHSRHLAIEKLKIIIAQN